uniref:hypothetical protein RF1 n=1 Tax=Vallesia antillana TaxID=141627 RepID=UPI00233F4FB0|nr:hypothetical protein RF1 [Vallesia antillana]WBU94927.1 hypothetical protein RF1 [Vallesia antillana]
MIFQSFLLGNLVSLCMKIINSVVVVGLYYGFLTAFSIGPSYLFLLRAQVIEEGTEKKVSATTGFIMGQLMMFISIYYAPLHLALGRPHTITVLALPYLLFHFFWNNHKDFFDYVSTTRNLMRNLSIQCVFLNNLIFQLLNHFILPSSMLARLVNISMFRCNNKMLFVTSSFVGWLIGHILFMKWLGLVLVWIRQNHSIRSNKYSRKNKYLVLEFLNSMVRIFSILLFITCVYYLGRIPVPSLSKKLKETSKTEERDVEIETTYGIKQEQEGSTEDDPSSYLFSEEKEDPDKIDETEEIRVNGKEKTKDEFDFHFTETGYNNSPVYEDSYLNMNGNQENSKFKVKKKELSFYFEKSFVILLFDSNRWNRPLRYIKNTKFERAVRNEMSQYFFDTCQSDGKQRISFTYPPSLSIFEEMLKKKISLSKLDKTFSNSNEFDNLWVYSNKLKRNKISQEFRNRIKTLDKKSFFRYIKNFIIDILIEIDIFDIFDTRGKSYILETRTRLCNDDTKNEYFSKVYDPLLNGPYRGIMRRFSLSKKKLRQKFDINRIYAILFPEPNYQEFEQETDTFHQEQLLKEVLPLTGEFDRELKSNKNFLFFLDQGKGKMDFEKKRRFFKFLFNAIRTHTNGKKIQKKSIGIKEISKKVPRWSYKLITDTEHQTGDHEGTITFPSGIRSKKATYDLILTAIRPKYGRPDPDEEVIFVRYLKQPDFRRGLIKGSMRAQRRKLVSWGFLQVYSHSPLFFDRARNWISFLRCIKDQIQMLFLSLTGKRIDPKLKKDINERMKSLLEVEDEKKVEKKEMKQEDILDDMEEFQLNVIDLWEELPYGLGIRSLVLLTQSILRKYILFPSLIIAKNIVRMLLLQVPEWFEDIKEWKKETHIRCTHTGVPFSETDFPKNWLTDGMHIQVLFPFYLKPWHKSKLRSYEKNIKKQKDECFFLTGWGSATEYPFGSPTTKKGPSFFEPIFKELKRTIGKLKRMYLLALMVLKGKTKLVSKESNQWTIESLLFLNKSILFLKRLRLIEGLSKLNPIRLFSLREIFELNETKNEKDSRISNQRIHESFSQIQSSNWTNSSLTEKQKKHLTDRTNTIRNQIEKIRKDKKSITPVIYISPTKRSSNAKRLESLRNIWQILKRRNVRLISELDCFIKIFVEKIYIDIFLSIITISRLNTQPFLESIKKIMDKPININQTNQERLNTKNHNKLLFISTILTLRESIDSIRNKTELHRFCDLSNLSQAYVFYKLSQTQVSNLSKLRSIFQYYGMSFFIKTEIKDFFATQGIIQSELNQKKLPSYGMNQWKNWLKGHYQYDLSRVRWSGLRPQKWRNRINRCRMAQKQNWNLKWDSYESLIHSKKQNDSEIYSLLNEKYNFHKNSRYDLLSSKSINLNSENKRNSSIDRSPFQVQINKNENISYNSNKHKGNPFDRWGGIPINNYGDIRYMEKNPDRKYFDWKILNFALKQKATIGFWIKMDTKENPTNIAYSLVYLMLPQNLPKLVLDWMEMNEKILNRPISNLRLWFFPEFVLLYNIYKLKPWVISSKVFLLNCKLSENVVSENKTIDEKKKVEYIIPSNKKIKNQNQKEKEKEPIEGQKDLRSNVQKPGNTQARSKRKYAGSTRKGSKKKQQYEEYKSHREVQLNLFLDRYLIFQLRYGDLLDLDEKIINHLQLYNVLLRAIDPRRLTISSIRKQRMSLEIMPIQRTFHSFRFRKWMEMGLLFIEPARLSVKNDGQFILYQTLWITVVHKTKDQTHEKYREQTSVDKNDLLVPENILSHRRRRELRILISLNSKNRNRNQIFCPENNCSQFLDKRGHLDKAKKELIQFKFFLWPNYRVEDLACMNRYWFDTTNGSRSSMLRIHMYPRLKSR